MATCRFLFPPIPATFGPTLSCFFWTRRRRPKFVAGVPPDYFSAQGQLWGNPVYNWEALGETGYRWWIERFRALLSHVDLIRLDHFRGFAAAWHIPSGAPTAQTGAWQPGPGAEFFRRVEADLGGLPFIAEDLGLITPDVENPPRPVPNSRHASVCSSPSMGMRTILTFPRTSSVTP